MKSVYPVFFTKADTVVLIEVSDFFGRRRTPSWLNYEVEQAGINVSKLLQESLMKALHVKSKY